MVKRANFKVAKISTLQSRGDSRGAEKGTEKLPPSLMVEISSLGITSFKLFKAVIISY
jgi:hypothetical protein